MKGLYILIALLILFSILCFMVVKPTDTDVQRKYDQILNLKIKLDEDLLKIQTPLKKLRTLKPRTNLLDKENEALKSCIRDLQSKLSVLKINIDQLSDKNREACTDMLEAIRNDMEKIYSSLSIFGVKVRALHDFLAEANPLYAQMESLQKQIKGMADLRRRNNNPFPDETLKDIESYNSQCKEIQNFKKLAIKSIHNNREEGAISGKTAINQIKDLLPTMEAFVKDLKK